MKTRTIKVEMLARVEGEGALTLRFRDHELLDVQLKIFEPPRFFEAFLRGRRLEEAPDITARICGICPIAYQISSVTAMESALGIRVDGALRDLRRLIYCGEWIESHMLHLHMLHAPDFLGYEDAVQMAKDFPEEVKRGLRLKKLGNEIMTVVGGREIHPVNIRVGGFHGLPDRQALRDLRVQMEPLLEDAVAVARWVATLPFPAFDPETVFVGMRHPTEYPLFEGRLVSTNGLDIGLEEFEAEFIEEHEEHSNALHGHTKDGGIYQVGPIARYNLNSSLLTERAHQVVDEIGLPARVTNPFQSIIVRAVETVFAIEESMRILDSYEPPAAPNIEYERKAGIGVGCSEAPRGICWHRYQIDDEGLITEARIVPPTSQNLPRIEQDLREYVPPRLNLPEDRLRWECEQAIRNYDPCISCATHFVRLKKDLL